jgi:hypothetical protein
MALPTNTMTTLLVIIALAFVFIRSTPYVVLVALHNPVIIFLSIVVVLYLTTAHPKLGVLGLLYLGGLYLERNRLTLYKANNQYLVAGGPGPALSEDYTMPRSPSQHRPNYMMPVRNSYPYVPASDCDLDGNEFSPADRSIDHKRPPLKTVAPGYATTKTLFSF